MYMLCLFTVLFIVIIYYGSVEDTWVVESNNSNKNGTGLYKYYIHIHMSLVCRKKFLNFGVNDFC